MRDLKKNDAYCLSIRLNLDLLTMCDIKCRKNSPLTWLLLSFGESVTRNTFSQPEPDLVAEYIREKGALRLHVEWPSRCVCFVDIDLTALQNWCLMVVIILISNKSILTRTFVNVHTGWMNFPQYDSNCATQNSIKKKKKTTILRRTHDRNIYQFVSFILLYILVREKLIWVIYTHLAYVYIRSPTYFSYKVFRSASFDILDCDSSRMPPLFRIGYGMSPVCWYRCAVPFERIDNLQLTSALKYQLPSHV